MPDPTSRDTTPARLFLALWPDAEARAALLRLQQAWHWPDGAKLVPPDKLHITLHFLGAVPREQLTLLLDALPMPTEPVPLAFREAAIWKGGVAVLRAVDVPPSLTRLHAQLAAVLTALGLPVESRPFVPHVTLARGAREARPPAMPFCARLTAQGYRLVESRGGLYQVLRHCGEGG